MQETVIVASMVSAGQFFRTGDRGRRRGANIGRTREIWPTIDGFVSFGIRGGKARVASLELIAEQAGLPPRDWAAFNQNTADEADLAAIEAAVAAYFASHTMQELYDLACETNAMLAPINSPREILASAQLADREFFGPVEGIARFPRAFAVVRSADGEVAPVRPEPPTPFAPRERRIPHDRPGPSPPGTSSSTARPCCESNRGRVPTSCARWPSAPPIRTGSRARPCTTASTSGSATSRST
jgi:crotonobetainyl-CoA:carnitine CoA-transferase CaiB-like acyl-CoA transferase